MSLCQQEPTTEGTVKAHVNFNDETDARALRDAMKGFGEQTGVCSVSVSIYTCTIDAGF